MKRLARFTLVLGLLMSGSDVIAEPVAWDQCVSEVAKSNPDLASSRTNLKAADYQYKAAFNGFLPQVSGILSYNRQNFFGSASNTNPGSENFYSASLNATENLFSGFLDRSKVEQASANFDLARANLDSSRAKASFDLKSAFASLQYAQNSVKLSQDISKRQEDNLRLVELHFEGGIENKGSYYLSKATVSQAHFEVLQANDSILTSQEQLARILGRNSCKDLSVSGDLPLLAPPQAADFGSLIPAIPSHRQAIAQERVSRASITLARSSFYPGLVASASYGKQGTDWFPGDTRWSVGLTLTVPLFNGGRDYFGTESAIENLSSAEFNRESVDRQLTVTLQQTYNTFMEAVEKLKVDQEFQVAASIRAEIARSKYNNGLLSYEDWNIIENDLIARQKTVLQSQRDRTIAEAAWEQVQGKGVIP